MSLKLRHNGYRISENHNRNEALGAERCYKPSLCKVPKAKGAFNVSILRMGASKADANFLFCSYIRHFIIKICDDIGF